MKNCLVPILLVLSTMAGAQPRKVRVAVAGSEPFVVNKADGPDGISLTVWREVAGRAGWTYEVESFENVAAALRAVEQSKADVAVGPISITAERARKFRFSQPYFQASLSILSRTESMSVWERIRPFFSRSFFTAVVFLLVVLLIVGTIVWLAERRIPDSHFPTDPLAGIGNGVWFAIVTMSTVGYGDLSPKSPVGRIATGVWIIVSIVAASSLVAGIASTLTLTGLQSSQIESAEQLSGRRVAALPDSPGERFAERHGAAVVQASTLQDGYGMLTNGAVEAVVFDRPQLLYFLRRRGGGMSVSVNEYERQNYGFAMRDGSPLAHPLNVSLLELKEDGRVQRIVADWVGRGE
ncbi:MAG: transporter substrate-binding domain-containing protein [Bryobacteraceae bacterium]